MAWGGGGGGLRGPPPLLLIGKSLNHETWHTYEETYSVQIFVTIFFADVSIFSMTSFSPKDPNFF